MQLSIHLPAIGIAALGLAMATTPLSAGTIKGANGHIASGSASITAGQVEFGADFVFDGGPDVYVAVKKANKLHLLGKLRENSGAQSYRLPSNGAADGADQIILWCKQYNVTLGRASAN